jgi:Coenzyme PQQ synthesis protein D (PqqD)
MAPRRVEGLLVERTAGEILIHDPATDEAHALNETAALVYDLCDGTTSRAAMATEIGRRAGLPADEGIVDLALGELVEAGLVETEEAERPTVTRRSLIRRLALPAAAVAMLPIVETILVPTASAQAPKPPAPPKSKAPAP